MNDSTMASPVRTRSRVAAVGAAGLVAFLGGTAFAAPEGAPPTPAASTDKPKEPVAEAAAHYARGIELYKEENYKGALVEFRRSYELTSEYRVLYNIAQLCFQTHDYVGAYEAFDAYLKKGGSQIPTARVTEVRGEIAKLKGRIGWLKLQVNVVGADVVVDDVPRGKTPLDEPLALSTGPHRLSISAPGRVPVTRAFEVAGNDTASVDVSLIDLEPVVRDREPRPQEQPPPSRWTALSFVGLAGAGALGVGSAVAGILAINDSNKMQRVQYVGDPSDEARSLQSDVKTLRLTADILAAAAIVTGVTTLVLTLTRSPEARKTSAGFR
jgi:hypothetical protein